MNKMKSIYGIIDIDNFGLFNLEHSFEKGNNLLIDLEKLLSTILKPYDWRKLDGDEFLFIMNGNFESNKQEILHAMNDAEKKYGVTISVGLLELDTGYSFKQVIFDLKKNLIIAKEEGKNKICLDNEICAN